MLCELHRILVIWHAGAQAALQGGEDRRLVCLGFQPTALCQSVVLKTPSLVLGRLNAYLEKV